jgi:hypothetical protein
MFRLGRGVKKRPQMSENAQKDNDIAVAMYTVIKLMVDIAPLHKVYLTVTTGKHSYNV